MATKGFFAKLFDPQLPQNSSSSSSSSWVNVESPKSTIDTRIIDYLAKFSLDENEETTLPFDPFIEANKEKAKAKSTKNEKPLEKVKTFPPPISSLKLFKTGKRCTYVSYNQDEKKFVVEEVMIPNRDMLRANREGGRLKLYFSANDDEETEDEEGK